MAELYSVVGYHLAGLTNPVVLSATKIDATVKAVAFGHRTLQEEKAVDLTAGETRAQAWLRQGRTLLQSLWEEELAEPSFAVDFEIAPLSTLETPLIDIDDTLTQAATYAVLVRALAERAGVTLPPLADIAVVVGAIAADGTLSCRPYAVAELVQACSEIVDRRVTDRTPTRCLIGPFLRYDATVADRLKGLDMTIQPVRTVHELLRVILGNHPEQILRTVLEQFALFDRRTQGSEAKDWQEAELRWAETPRTYETYLNEVQERRPESTILQHAVDAAATLVEFRNGTDREVSQRLSTELTRKGYLLTAIWLLVRRSFLLRERREGDEADRCLATAQNLQRRSPLEVDTTVLLLHQHGRSRYFQVRFVEALQLHWRGYKLLAADTCDDVLGADCCNSAGKCFNDIYELSLALELFEHARRIYGQRRQDEKLLFNVGARAEAYWRIGEFKQAQELYKENLRRAENLEGGWLNQPQIMRGKNNVALILFAQGNAQEAELVYQEVIHYYRAGYEQGNQSEFSSLMYSVTGFAQAKAAQAKWDHVTQLVKDYFNEAERLVDPQKDPACLPVALLAYVNAQRLRRDGATDRASQWLEKAAHLLSHFYPMEQAMIRLEQVLLALTTQTEFPGIDQAQQLKTVEEAREQIFSFLDTEADLVRQQFVLFRERLESGRGELANGKQLYEREQASRAELRANFAAVADQLQTNKASSAITSLRAIQSFVPYFRDLIAQLDLHD